MPMQPVYLVAVKNLPKFVDAVRHAQAPEKFNLRFVEELGFTSTNDRLFIPLFKAMKFLDEGGKPTARYHEFLDGTQWKRVLADGIKDAYADLFRVNRNAHAMPRDQVAGKLRSLTEGKASASVVTNTTKTFQELVKLADFSTPSKPAPEAQESEAPIAAAELAPADERERAPVVEMRAGQSDDYGASPHPSLVYRIEIVLPAVRDQAIYDAIFRSAKEHLLR